jgi:hypothetical protein
VSEDEAVSDEENAQVCLLSPLASPNSLLSDPELPSSLSTSEAEYVAASQCGQEVIYLREILRDSDNSDPLYGIINCR